MSNSSITKMMNVYNKNKYAYLQLHKNNNNINKINNLNGGSEHQSIPIIEFYEYKIQNYNATFKNYYSDENTDSTDPSVWESIQKYKFKTITEADHDSCSLISAESTNPLIVDVSENDIVTCDILSDTDDVDIDIGIDEPITDANMIHQFYLHLNDMYVTFKTRININEMTNIDDDGFCSIYKGYITKILDKIYKDHKELCEKHQIKGDESYVRRLKIKPDEKIVIFGDVHGSLHTFVRSLFRLHRCQVIDLTSFKINDGYRIIFLGDVVDRGFFSLEIVFAIMLLIYINNKDDPKIIFNRGNHEEQTMNKQSGFHAEIMKRCKKDIDIYNEFNDVFDLFSSAVLLEMNNHKFWLSHGGFPFDFEKNESNTSDEGSDSSDQSDTDKNDYHQNKFGLPIKLDFDHNKDIIKLSPIQAVQTRWTDFTNYNVKSKDDLYNKSRYKSGDNDGYIRLNKYHVKEFLDQNKINFIIRGHQDNYFNSYLFSNQSNPDIRANGAFGISEERKAIKDVLIYNDLIKSVDKRVGVDGPIARLVVDKKEFIKSNDYYYANASKNVSKNNQKEVYPVLTISTNTDNNRFLHKDSFVILRFDLPKEEINDFHKKLFFKLVDLPKKIT